MTHPTKSKGSKNDLDQFYTNPKIALECIKSIPHLDKYDMIIEPSAGTGSFLQGLQKIKLNSNAQIRAYDLDPKHPNIIKSDWLKVDKTQFMGHSVLVLGNPPFGRQGSLAKRFITTSSFADTIAFVLPKSFNKVSVQNTIPQNFKLMKSVDLSKNAFILNNKPYNLPAVFQIWEKSTIKRQLVKIRKQTPFFEFSNSTDFDIRIIRIGGRTGKADTFTGGAKYNYFIKNKSKLSNQELIDLINQTEFAHIDDTAGPRSLSKHELITTLEPKIKKVENNKQ